MHHENGVLYRYEQQVGGIGCEASDLEAAAGNQQLVYGWLLTQVEDLAGNYMTVEYQQVPLGPSDTVPDPLLSQLDKVGCQPVEWIPTDMTYTGHRTLGAGRRVVHFSFSDVSAPRVEFVSGQTTTCVHHNCSTRPVSFALATSRQLSEVEMRGPDRHVARTYSIVRDESAATGRARVTQIQECYQGIRDCREPLVFHYTEATLALGTDIDLGTTTTSPDGIANHATSPLSPSSTIAHADFDGDGADDLLLPQVAGNWTVLRYRDVGTRPFIVPDLIVARSNSVLAPFDYDGDGMAEVLVDEVNPAGRHELHGHRLRGDGPLYPDLPNTYGIGDSLPVAAERCIFDAQYSLNTEQLGLADFYGTGLGADPLRRREAA